MKYSFLLILVALILFGCENTNNFKDAIVNNENGRVSIKLLANRRLMVHSPTDLFKKTTFIDSLIIYTPQLKEGKITSIEIPVPEGYYKFDGSISKHGTKLTVTVFIEDTTQKKLIPSDWNGVYNLVK